MGDVLSLDLVSRLQRPRNLTRNYISIPNISFLGLNTNRGNHMEKHALVDGRAKWNRTAVLHGQLQPSGLGARIQYEATSLWGILPKDGCRRNAQRGYDNQDMVMRVNSSTKSQLSDIAPISQLTNSSHHGTRRISIKHKQSSKVKDDTATATATATDQRKARTSSKWLSVETTFAIR